MDLIVYNQVVPAVNQIETHPFKKHWHGAAPTTAMTHIAIQEQLDGKAVEWLEKVSDEQYQETRR